MTYVRKLGYLALSVAAAWLALVSVGDLLLLAAAALITVAVVRVAAVTVSRPKVAPDDALRVVVADLQA